MKLFIVLMLAVCVFGTPQDDLNQRMCSSVGDYNCNTLSCDCNSGFCGQFCEMNFTYGDIFCSDIYYDLYGALIGHLNENCTCECIPGYQRLDFPGVYGHCQKMCDDYAPVWGTGGVENGPLYLPCNGHGTLIPDGCTCLCDPGWGMGENSIRYCQAYCPGHSCLHGYPTNSSCLSCTCNATWCGPYCDKQTGDPCDAGANMIWNCETDSCEIDCKSMDVNQCLDDYSEYCFWGVPCSVGMWQCMKLSDLGTSVDCSP